LGTGSRNSITTPAVFSTNNWYHVVVNVRGANDMDFYINGVKNTSCTYDGYGTTMVYTTAPSMGVIGVFPGAGSAFDGVMDDYRIYKRSFPRRSISFVQFSTLIINHYQKERSPLIAGLFLSAY
jgi:hypothetical protein